MNNSVFYFLLKLKTLEVIERSQKNVIVNNYYNNDYLKKNKNFSKNILIIFS